MSCDLEKTCPTCGGAGWLPNPEWASWWRRFYHEDWRKALRELEDCPDSPASHPCSGCSGLGGIPTAAGHHLLTFISRHLEDFESKTRQE
jgi:hypothetical protein